MKMNRIQLRRLIESVINEKPDDKDKDKDKDGDKNTSDLEKLRNRSRSALDDLENEKTDDFFNDDDFGRPSSLGKRKTGKKPAADDKPTPPKDLEPIQISKSEEVEIDQSMIKPPKDPQNQKEAEEQLKACIAAINASDNPAFDQMEIVEKYKVNDRAGYDPQGKQKSNYKYLEVGTKGFEIHDRGLYDAYTRAGSKKRNLRESFGLSRGSLYRRRYSGRR